MRVLLTRLESWVKSKKGIFTLVFYGMLILPTIILGVKCLQVKFINLWELWLFMGMQVFSAWYLSKHSKDWDK